MHNSFKLKKNTVIKTADILRKILNFNFEFFDFLTFFHKILKILGQFNQFQH